MTIGLNNPNMITEKLATQLEKAGSRRADAMEKMATGEVFTSQDPRPSERAVSENMEFRLRSLASSKKNINDTVSLLQTAESGLSEINNMIVRLKELNIAASTTNVTDRERRYMFIEYQALYDEMNRIAKTTEFNGIPLLNGEDSRTPEELVFRLDDPYAGGDSSVKEDINVLRFDGLKSIVATAEGLGIGSARDLLADSNDLEGIALEDVEQMLQPEEEGFATVYDEALNKLSTQRAVFGAMQSRMQKAADFVDVYQENIAAAKAKISDTDYAREIVKLTESNILMQAASGLLAQSNFDSNITLNLLSSVAR